MSSHDESDLPTAPMSGPPVTDADLHGYVDAQLTAARRAEVERHLASRPDERARVDAWQRHKTMLHGLLDHTFRSSTRRPSRAKKKSWS